METIRRWYIYLVSGVSLNAVVWAVITLFWDLLVRRSAISSISFQIAVLIILLPVYLIHWLWAQRLAQQNTLERGSFERRLYIYVILAAMLAPALYAAYNLLLQLFSRWMGDFFATDGLTAETIGESVLTILILGVFWFYHWRILSQEQNSVPEGEAHASIRRLYIFGFSLAGLMMLANASAMLLQALLWRLGMRETGSIAQPPLVMPLTGALIGLPLWLYFWNTAQNLFSSKLVDERESVLRKFYLYLIVFGGVLYTVTNLTFLFNGLLRQLLGLETSGNLSIPVSIIAVAGVVWAYHAWVLMNDAKQHQQVPNQLAIRRLYLYLLAFIGLLVLLSGLFSLVDVIIRNFAQRFVFSNNLQEQFAWAIALVAAGLPLWVLSWRPVQNEASADNAQGREERRSIIRKIYLYLFLFLATVAVLSGLVYIVFQLVSNLLGGMSDPKLIQNLSRAVAYTLIGAVVWAGNWWLLRADWRQYNHEQARRLKDVRAVLVGWGESAFGKALQTAFQRELPELTVQASLSNELDADAEEILSQAQLIICPAYFFTHAVEMPALLHAVQTSSARKLVVSHAVDGWHWVGQDIPKESLAIEQTVQAIRHWANGAGTRTLRAWSVLFTIAGALLGIILLTTLFRLVTALFN